MPLAVRLGRRTERRNLGGSDIRKPGDLPAIELKRTDGVFRDLRMWARVARPAGYTPFRIWGLPALTATLYVCMTCRAGQPLPDGEVAPGAHLMAALTEAGVPEGVTVRGVECLSACDHGCTVAVTKPGGWSYVYGRMTPADAPEILRGVGLYAATADGLVPWRDRPVIFRKQSIARLPPLES